MHQYLLLFYLFCGIVFCIHDWHSTLVNRESMKDQYEWFRKMHKEYPCNPEYMYSDSGLMVYWILIICLWPLFSIPYIDAFYKKVLKKEGIW